MPLPVPVKHLITLQQPVILLAYIDDAYITVVMQNFRTFWGSGKTTFSPKKHENI